MRKAQEFVIKGMNRDLSVSKFNPEFAYENMNIRITARDSNTLLSVTNERGNSKVSIVQDYKENGISASIYMDGDTKIASLLFDSQLPLDGSIIMEVLVPASSVPGFRITISPSDIGVTKFPLPAEYYPVVLSTICNVVEQTPVTNVCYFKQGNYTQKIPEYETEILGRCIGKEVINDYLVLFTVDDLSRIYRLKRYDKGFKSALLYAGSLGFDINHPIQSIGIYENEDIQKVYWTDGINSPRVINIMSENHTWTDNSFNFVSTLQLNEDVSIQKIFASSGVFPSGVIQYAFAYYNKYGSESNLFYTSPLNYITALDRGLSAEDNASIAFEIQISGADRNFEYIRVFSILRTSIDATPVAKVVADIPIGESIVSKTVTILNVPCEGNITYTYKGVTAPITGLTYIDAEAGDDIVINADSIYINGESTSQIILPVKKTSRYQILPSNIGGKQNLGIILTGAALFEVSYASNMIRFTDTNTSGYTIDPTELLYIGGEDIVCGCICHKDNTLFMGDIKLKRESVFDTETDTAIKASALSYSSKTLGKFTQKGYSYDFQLNNTSWNLTSFKYLETYRFGIQALHTSGRWSEVLFVKDLKNTISPNVSDTAVSGSKATINIPAEISKKLMDKGYVKVRGVVVYPSVYDRSILCQGYVQPTMYNTQDRVNNNPFSIPSWQLRLNTDTWMDKYLSQVPVTDTSAEISYDIYSQNPYYEDRNGEGKDTYLSNYGDKYYVDLSICNLYTPELEASDDLNNIDLSSYDFRIVGGLSLDNTVTDFYLDMESMQQNKKARGFIKSVSNLGRLIFGNYPMYEDTIANTWEVYKDPLSGTVTGMVIPADSELKAVFSMHLWQGSENIGWHYLEGKETDAYGKIKRKIVSQVQWCGKTIYTDSPYIPPMGILDKQVCTSNEMSLTRLNTTAGNISYYQNLDKLQHAIISKGYESNPVLTKESGYPQRARRSGGTFVDPINFYYKKDKTGSYAPVRIKFRTANHIVFSFNASGTNQYTMPTPYEQTSDSSTAHKLPWSTPIKGWVRPSYNIAGASDIWIGEFYKSAPAFGGNSEQALMENKWVVGGPAVRLDANNTITVEYLQGDTYFQRWDSLRLSPMTDEDFNSNIQILSFMCESRINLDGRYDRNRGIAGLALSDKNFNLMNPVYSQKDNFFTPQYLDKDSLELDTFSNIITWTKTKTLGEVVDSWTNITLASTLDLDGDKGRVRAMEVFNSDILAFQDNALAHILFNSRVQMNASDGVPIEIANSGKVDGKRYISNHIGTVNKFAIANTPLGVLFEDNYSNSLYLFNGQISDISDSKGFRSWSNQVIGSYEYNKPLENIMTCHYDRSNGDIYINTPDYCLGYSSLLSSFTSFYDYKAIPFMFNIADSFYSIRNKDGKSELWEQFRGDYNYFYGEYKPFYVHFIANPEMQLDKVFDTLEFRADSFTEDGDAVINTFDNLYVWNEYQNGHSVLTFSRNDPSSLKRRFRVWRAILPRDSKRRLNRIRNTWLNIKLSKENENNFRTILHDMTLHYTV